ncbi:MAG: 50S ribosomal protein L10 [bacterium]|nr:50S ribosomal protein L10 [bacterium]
MSETAVKRHILPEKQEIVSELQDRMEDSVATIFINYRGLKVSQFGALRSILREHNTQMKVYKNSFTRIALQNLSVDLSGDATEGPTALFFIKDDAATASKAIVTFMKENDAVVLKGGILSRAPISEATIQELAKLPSKDELIAKVVGSFRAPIDQFVLNLSSPLRGLVYVLSAIKDQKE